MHKVTLLAVGALKLPWAADACAEYARRLRGEIALEITELPASKERDPVRQQEQESGRVSDALEKRGGTVYILDERGEQITSPGFAALLAGARDRGDPLTFVLGGAYGLSEDVRSRGRLLSLSAMTLPHELCRVLFLEQLYRAVQIGRGSGYHH